MWTDFKYALRLLLKAPAFTALTIVVMTCGLAISLYMYSFLNTIVFKPLPFADSENVVVLDKVTNGTRSNYRQLNAADLIIIESENRSFEKLHYFYSTNKNITIDKVSRRYFAAGIEPGGIDFTQVKPLLGRTFDKKDAQLGARTIISYDLWVDHFNKNKGVIGQFLQMENSQVTIIGVMPKGFSFPLSADLWLPLSRNGMHRGTNWTLGAFTKLKEGVSLVAANEDLNNIMAGLAGKYPSTNYGTNAYAETFQKQLVGEATMPAVWALLGVTIFVLLLACVNVSGLLLSKAIERSRETAVRRALGAPRYRVIMQMMWESTIICVVSGLFSLMLVSWALQLTTPIFAQMSFIKPFYWLVFGLDSNTVIAAVIVVIFTIIVSGFFPAWKVTSGDFNALLRQGSRGATNARVGRLSKILLTVEVALSTLVLIIATMLIINTYQSTALNKSYDKQNLLTFSLQFPWSNYESTATRSLYLQKLEKQLEAIPEINNISYGSASPGGDAWVTQINPHYKSYQLDNIFANLIYINSDYFAQVKIKPIAGRLINKDDTIQSKKVAVISSSLAKQLWPNEDPLGKLVSVPVSRAIRVEVIGVVPHIHHGATFNTASNYGGIYLANRQFNHLFNQVTVDYSGSRETVIAEIDAVMYQLDKNIPPFMIMAYDALLAKYMSAMVFGAKLFAILGFITLVLTASGIYGVTANSIYQRLREIGIRRALGATNLQVVSYFLKQASMQLIIGLSIGLLLGASVCYWVLPQFLVSSTIMLVIFVSIFTLIMLVVISAVLLPLKRVLKFEPAHALRSE
ncbi:MAG: putative ABC transport system permease protein [Psychromonas sp.]|jgi:putative ABC transport system permease protein|uniref:ABC transporter permease n=1 Tax=Psychromonas sp. TaxID=1884585 RepID=UPI0039E37B24